MEKYEENAREFYGLEKNDTNKRITSQKKNNEGFAKSNEAKNYPWDQVQCSQWACRFIDCATSSALVYRVALEVSNADHWHQSAMTKQKTEALEINDKSPFLRRNSRSCSPASKYIKHLRSSTFIQTGDIHWR